MSIQPPLLIVRLMLNLRQLGEWEKENTDRQHVSIFSVPNFAAPSDFLGNIGEELDHDQAQRYIYGDDEDLVITSNSEHFHAS